MKKIIGIGLVVLAGGTILGGTLYAMGLKDFLIFICWGGAIILTGMLVGGAILIKGGKP